MALHNNNNNNNNNGDNINNSTNNKDVRWTGIFNTRGRSQSVGAEEQMCSATGKRRDWRDSTCVCACVYLDGGRNGGGTLWNRKSFFYHRPIWEIECTEAGMLVNTESKVITQTELLSSTEKCYFCPGNNFINNKMTFSVCVCMCAYVCKSSSWSYS
jgi:hypothetical protein